MAKIKEKKEKPAGKPVKNKGWKDLKDYLKSIGYGITQVDEAFGLNNPKYATDIEIADALRRFLNVM